MMRVVAFAALLLVPQGGVEDLERRLKDAEERTRREAVQGLAKLASAEAWELVLDALRDPEPMVADEAQLALGDSGREDVQGALLGKDGIGAKDGLVRLRAAEALGRIELELDAGPLLKKLKDKDPELRRTIAWTIERQARAGRLDLGGRKRIALLDALEVLRKKDKDPGVQAAAFMAEHVLDPDGDKGRWGLLDSSSPPELHAAHALQCRGVEGERALRSVRAVRSIEVDAWAEERTGVACHLLAMSLRVEPNRRLAWTIVGHLQELSGRKHGLDPQPWEDWIKDVPFDWVPDEPAANARDIGDRSVAFVGLPVLSERLVILVDFSGSLWEERDGKTRKERVDSELRRMLQALPETTHFNVVPYTNEPIPWKDELVPATKKSVADALDFFEGCKASGKGNAWGAFELAFAQDDVDTILVLTDGAPSGGTRWNLGLMADLLAEKNRFRRIALDALLVDAGGLERYWKRISEESGGRVLAIDL